MSANNTRKFVVGGALTLVVLAIVFMNYGSQVGQPENTLLARLDESAAPPSSAAPVSSATDSMSLTGRQLLDQFSAAFEEAAAIVNPSVVPIFSEATVSVSSPFGSPDDSLRQFFGDDFFRQFFGAAPGQQQQTVHALGSGVIVSSDGYILTNNHVTEGAQKLTVVLANEKNYPAKVIGSDPQTDLALLKVDADGLPAAVLGDSDSVKVGQWVLAIGNPFQLLHTTTAGIISAKGRSAVGLADYEDFIQTDAAINPGNSGGALADLDGKVIGINAAISSPTGSSVGLGFAIPINMAKSVMEKLRRDGRVIRGYLGVALQSLTPELSKALGIAATTQGALVGDVVTGGPADHAGFERGDVITEFDGTPVEKILDLRNQIANMRPGSKADAQVLRDGSQKTLHVTLGELPEKNENAGGDQSATPVPEKLGMATQTLTPELAQQLGYSGDHGALIVQIEPGSVAESAGLAQGDLIKQVNRTEIRTASELADRLSSLKSGETAALLVRRGPNTLFVALEMP